MTLVVGCKKQTHLNHFVVIRTQLQYSLPYDYLSSKGSFNSPLVVPHACSQHDTMNSYQSFRASSIDSTMSEEEKKNDEHENVDPTAPAPAFDDILTTVRKEEWYTVSAVKLSSVLI
jgi:hypothetical protein